MTKANIWKSFLLVNAGVVGYVANYLLTSTHDTVRTVIAVYLGVTAGVTVVYLVFAKDKK